MHITIEHHGDNFNVNLHSKEGSEAFLSIKGVRIVNGQNGPFLSFPAKKNESTGKWWNHVWANEKFAAVVLAKAQEGAPKQARRQEQVPEDSDVPF